MIIPVMKVPSASAPLTAAISSRDALRLCFVHMVMTTAQATTGRGAAGSVAACGGVISVLWLVGTCEREVGPLCVRVISLEGLNVSTQLITKGQ